MTEASAVEKAAWANVKENQRFIFVQTYSGYQSCRADPRGTQLVLRPDADGETLGAAVLDALSNSRFVLAESRQGVWIHPEASFDKYLYSPVLTERRYNEWVERLRAEFNYKSKRALFKGMKNCSLRSSLGSIVIAPSVHEKQEGWSGMPKDQEVVLPVTSLPAEVGAAVRLALSRCR